MTQAIATVRPDTKALAKPIDKDVLHAVIIGGDLSALTVPQQLDYYNAVCHAAGVNPATRPFMFIRLNNKLALYATKDCTEQLRTLHGVSVTDLRGELHEGLYVVTVKGQNAQGRTDMATGAVNVSGVKGDALANAIMKAETKAKRRMTLSICGLGMLDETEIETIPGATRVAQPDFGGETAAQAPASPAPAPQTTTTPPARPAAPPPANRPTGCTYGPGEDAKYDEGKKLEAGTAAKNRREVATALALAAQENPLLAGDWLASVTAFPEKDKVTKKVTGKMVPGCRSVEELSPGRVAVLHHDLAKKLTRDGFSEWMARRQVEAPPAPTEAAEEDERDRVF